MPILNTSTGLATQVLLGMTSSAIFPGLQGSFYWWSVPSEITQSISIQGGGVGVGSCLAAIITGTILKYLSWEFVFYVNGILMLRDIIQLF